MTAQILDKPTASRLVRQASTLRSLSRILDKGYDWFRAKFAVALRVMEAQSLDHEERRILANAFFLFGDVCDVYLDAPHAAIRAYRRTVKYDPNHSSAFREMGCMYERMGEYREAQKALRRAVAANPNDDVAWSDLEDLEHTIREPGSPFYSSTDPIWIANEHIASFKPEWALPVLKKKRSIRARLCRIRVRSAIGDFEGAIDEWNALGDTRGTIYLSWEDWFMVSDAIWDSPDFWRAMWTIAPRRELDTGGTDDGLEAHIPRPAGRNPWSRTALHNARRRNRLIARLHIARTRRMVPAVRKLCRRYPKWREARQVLLNLDRQKPSLKGNRR